MLLLVKYLRQLYPVMKLLLCHHVSCINTEQILLCIRGHGQSQTPLCLCVWLTSVSAYFHVSLLEMRGAAVSAVRVPMTQDL